MTVDDITRAVYRKEMKTLNKLTKDEIALVDKYKRTALMHAVLASDADPKVVDTLIARGADVNAADRDGWTALHFVAQDGKAELAQLLIDAGADVDAKDSKGCTPLWRMLIGINPVPVAKVLLKAGADPNAKDNFGGTPASRARLVGAKELVKLFAVAKPKSKTKAKPKRTVTKAKQATAKKKTAGKSKSR